MSAQRRPSSTSSKESQQEESEFDIFFTSELEWPLSSPSGMTPAMLAAAPTRLATLTKQGQATDGRTQSACEKLLHPRPPPRPEDLPWNVLTIQSDPPSVDIDDVEEFLVHDALFVEFFNAFLALPAFPEPICFNVETGGFEVVNDGRQKLATQIKEAMRSQNITPKMYRLAKRHAFATIPLIPIEDSDGPEGVEIDTSFQVLTLNKDQGIYWIKAERLPLFLESDFYFQYRLAKVISQARLFNDNKDFVVMKIDYTPRQKKVKKSEEVPQPNMEEIIVKKMYVSFGDVRGAAKEAWFTQAKDELSTTPTFTSLNPKVTTQTTRDGASLLDQQPPKSSVFRSSCFGVYTPGLMGPDKSSSLITDDNLLREQMFHHKENRPFTPRPSDTMYVATDSAWKKMDNDPEGLEKLVKPGQVVFMQPKQDPQYTDTESGIGEMDDRDEELERRMNMQPIIDGIYHDGSWEPNPNVGIEVKSLGDLGAVVVGAVMKKTLADMLSVSESKVLEDPVIRDIFPSEDLSCIDVDNVERCFAVYDPNEPDHETQKSPQTTIVQSQVPNPSEPATDSTESQNEATEKPKEPITVKWDRPLKKSAEEESDADSLLDSDDDFDERDILFRRKKDKWYNLTSMKGITNFKKFLEGTPGERYWELWIDIDKGRLLQDEDEEQRYSMYMRERYFKQGSPYELSTEDKNKLGLHSTGRWCTEYLFQIQGKVMEPLVLYWAPRYLLKNLLQSDPEKYQIYSHMKAALPIKEADPFPMTKSLLPLRPKSCCPRNRQGPGFEEMNSAISEVNHFKANEAEYTTSPMVGNRRVYGEDTLQRLALTPTAKYLGIAPPPKKEEKSEMEKMCTRPTTAGSSRSVSRIDEAGSVVNVTSSRKSDVSVKSGGPGKKRSTNGSVRRESEDQRSEGGFVGKLPGISKTERVSKSAVSRKSSNTTNDGVKARCRCKSAAAPKEVKKTALTESIRPSSVTVVSSSKSAPCPGAYMENMLGEIIADRTASGEILGPVKKPRDLLSPMLRILDTKGQRSRQPSASTQRCTSRKSEDITFYRQDSQDSSKTCDSRPTSGKVKDKNPVVDMSDCDFMGSERMESLLQALHHDQEAGRAFRKYMERTGNDQDVAINCLDFWARVQEYRKLFYKDKLDLFNITKHAKTIFAQYIVEGAPKSIEVSDSVELRVMQCLKPAYEDLFDEAEEHALKVLFAAFLEFLKNDVKTYCKVERTEITRRLETKNTYILNLQKKGIIKERSVTPEDTIEDYVDPVYDESILEKIPEELRDWTFDKLVHNRIELEHFRQYLAENYAEIDLKCWMDMEAWRRTAPTDVRKRDQRARDIKKLYLNKKYFFGPSSPAGKDGQNKVMDIAGGWGKFLEDKPNPEMILEAQKYVIDRLEKKHLPLFLLTKEFQDRQNPKMSQSDISDDVVVQKKRRSQAVLKVREEGEALFENIMKRLPTKRPKPNLDRLFPPVRQPSELEIMKPTALQTKDVTLPRISSKRKSSDKPDLNLATASGALISKDLLESKWVSSTKEIFLFKQALKNPVTCQQFQKYISIKGDNLENDLLFWLEVQRYKQMHHVHTEDSMLMQKINAIIHCFIDSPIPPSLQIDIPQEMAERILDHKHEKGPYLFRESQLATFRILLAHWTPFCEFRNNMGSDERALKTLERHRLLAIKKEREYQEQLERQKQREKQARADLDLDFGDDLPDELKEDDEDSRARISFSYAEYLAKEHLQTPGNEEDGTQTIRSMLEKSHDASSRQGSEKSEKLTNKGDTSVGDETDEIFQRHFRRTSTQSDRRRPSQLSELH